MRFKLLLALGAVVAMCLPGHAQSAKDVPEVAAWEIQRRGNHVERTGTIRSGLMAAALSPPEDDSHKWFLTLVVTPNDVHSAKAQKVIAEDKDFRAWADVGDAAKSTTHYHLRRTDDATQADWLAGIKPIIERDKLAVPLLVLQPPRTGQFGKPETVVKVMAVADLTGKQLSDKLRAAIIAYVQEMETPRGVAQAPIGGTNPPFNVPPPSNAPPPGGLPFEWPPAAPAALTVDQIKLACPGASPEFLIGVVESKETNIELIKMKWLLYQQNHHVVDEDDVSVNPSKPAHNHPETPMWMLALCLGSVILAFGAGMTTVLVGMWLMTFVRKKLDGLGTAIQMQTREQSSPPVPVQTVDLSSVRATVPPLVKS